MKKSLLILFLLAILSCKNEKKNTIISKGLTLITEDYQLVKAKNANALLVVFAGGGSSVKETKRDFKILDLASKKQISVVFMNYRSKLWLAENDCKTLSEKLHKIIKKNSLNNDKIFVGGMSIGGTTAISLANYLNKNSTVLKPKGVFVIDSPIDLFALYKSSIKDIKRKDFSEERLAEPKWIVSYFEEQFGEKDSLLNNIQKVSPFTLQTENATNIQYLKNTKLRFYTEPDTLWLKQNRQTDFESANAYTLQQTTKILKSKNWQKVELIQTKNKGYRFNGERNPHSWSIVNIDNFVNWVLKE